MEASQADREYLLEAAKDVVTHIEKSEIVNAAWAIHHLEELISDANTLAAYGLKKDNSDIMRPHLVKIEDDVFDPSRVEGSHFVID